MSSNQPLENLIIRLSILQDPRNSRGLRHRLVDIFAIALLSMICGADDAEDMEEFGIAHESWLKNYLELPHGIPSQDTFLRIFALFDPQVFREFFIQWVQTLHRVKEGTHIAIDGKTLRHSFDSASGSKAIHMVSAWLSDAGLVLGQQKTDEKSNEITAIPGLLEMLDIKGGIITIDAMGCQKEIVSKIMEKNADYVVALKGNQGNFHDEVSNYFSAFMMDDFKDVEHYIKETVDKGHGRLEMRRYVTISDIEWLGEIRLDWAGLKSIGVAESSRTIKGTTTTERRYFISSLSAKETDKFARAVRDHWSIENSLHWVLDMIFDEDASRARNKNAAENLAILRHISLNIIKNDKTIHRKKLSIKTKRKKAAWNPHYLMSLIGLGPM